MTEAEWFACDDPRQMLESLPGFGLGQGFSSCSCWRARCRSGGCFCPAYRKLRLFTLDCCQRIQPLLPQPVCRTAIKALGEYLEGEIGELAFDEAVIAFDTTRRRRFPKPETSDDGAWNALYCSVHRKWSEVFDNNYAERRWNIADTVCLDAVQSAGESEKQAQRHGLLDIFGNPFRPVVIDPTWLTSTVVLLARQMYESRDFSTMPILADAFQDAGCENADVLDHCRGSGPHVRGCWLIDAMLGKE